VTKDGKLYTRRLLSKTNNLPSWGHFVFKSQKQLVHIVEESLVDPATGFMKVYTWNVSYKYMMVSLVLFKIVRVVNNNRGAEPVSFRKLSDALPICG